MNEGLWELPAGWDVARLGRLVDIQSGFACSKKNLVPAGEGVAHLRPFNVGIDGQVDLSEVYYIPSDFKPNVEAYALEPGHVLFNNTNSVELVGKTALVTEPMPCAFSNHIYRLALKGKVKNRLEPTPGVSGGSVTSAVATRVGARHPPQQGFPFMGLRCLRALCRGSVDLGCLAPTCL